MHLALRFFLWGYFQVHLTFVKPPDVHEITHHKSFIFPMEKTTKSLSFRTGCILINVIMRCGCYITYRLSFWFNDFQGMMLKSLNSPLSSECQVSSWIDLHLLMRRDDLKVISTAVQGQEMTCPFVVCPLIQRSTVRSPATAAYRRADVQNIEP